MTKARPIIFSGRMVRAILDGRKTQTRRIVKPEPIYCGRANGYEWDAKKQIGFVPINDAVQFCPYGKPGDRIWVRETWVHTGDCIWTVQDAMTRPGRSQIRYRADGDEPWMKWFPSIFMPKWASRITLEITDVRVERLQDISNEDALAEGIEWPIEECLANNEPSGSPVSVFNDLWMSIYGDIEPASPWVWALTFRKVETA